VRRAQHAFFYKASAVWPICSQATVRKAFSKANSYAHGQRFLGLAQLAGARAASFTSSACSRELPYHTGHFHTGAPTAKKSGTFDVVFTLHGPCTPYRFHLPHIAFETFAVTNVFIDT